jgi:8-oxo-dGTP pyrophosphatase MutT (NUDIX family)
MRPRTPARIATVIDSAMFRLIGSRLARALRPPVARYRPLRVDGEVAGWLTDARAERLRAFDEVFRVGDDDVTFAPVLDAEPARTRALARIVATLAEERALTAWRDELYPCAAAFAAPPWFLVERAAARYFGIHTWAAHVNGLVVADGDMRMWFARRSARKSIDPGMLDNLVGGGIAAGESVAAAVAREAWEEAGIVAGLAAGAIPAGAITLRREQPDGLQWETIFVHDVRLPAAFVPAGQDGEVVAHRLATLPEVARLLSVSAGPDQVTVDASLVALDCLLRLDVQALSPAERDALRTLCGRDAA